MTTTLVAPAEVSAADLAATEIAAGALYQADFNAAGSEANNDDLFARLARMPLFEHLSRQKIECLNFVRQGTELHFEVGDVVVAEGDAPDFFVLLDGRVQIVKKVGDRDMVLGTHDPGAFFGEIPLLLGTRFVASGRALTPCHIFRLDQAAFWQMLPACPSITQQILRTMAQRMQSIEAIAQGREKLVSLGTMAAGLAHELNNPASATRRAAEELRETTQSLPSLACKLSKEHLTPEQADFLAQVQREVTERRARVERLDALAQSDRETEIEDWLEAHGVAEGWKLAPTLVESGLDPQWLDCVAARMPEHSLAPVLTWAVATFSVASLVGQIDDSTSRISGLVKAIKSYSYMDQAPEQEIDIHEGLESTLTLLHHKMKNVSLTCDYDRTLPTVCAFGSELNQVWTNLIDNAVYAVGGKGNIHIRTAREGDFVLVEIIDDGPGIPQDIQGRIFEPFFTTKDIGTGTGLGLVTSYRIVVGHHHGDLRFESQPGRTNFQVRLPFRKSA